MAKRATAKVKAAKPARVRKPKKSAKAAATETAQDALPSTTPDPNEKRAIFDKHFRKIKTAKKFLDLKSDERASANADYRNALKAAKGAGLDADAIRMVLQLQERDPDDVTLQFSNLNNYLLWAGLPIGTQLGLFSDGITVATRVDEEAQARQNDEAFQEGRPLSTEASIREARTKGFDDGTEGKTALNTYDEGSPEALAYAAEYNRAQEKIALGLGKKNGNGAEAGATA